MNEDVTIIILTHKSKKLVLDYIKNLYKKFKIIIIDNSNDLNLKSIITKSYPGIDIHLIPNNGYGNQINYGSKLVTTEYFLISNPDLTGIDELSISNFVSAAKKLNNKFSTLGPRFVNANPKSHKQSINNGTITEMKFISGACMFFNKNNFDNLNGFDENIFLYFEETDYCKRASKRGLKAYQINEIKVKTEGRSVLIKNKKEKKKLNNILIWHFIWSKYYFTKKNKFRFN